ncbi:MAG: hypothetical protein V4498_00325 [candidate division FCPU426 bacterium]
MNEPVAAQEPSAGEKAAAKDAAATFRYFKGLGWRSQLAWALMLLCAFAFLGRQADKFTGSRVGVAVARYFLGEGWVPTADTKAKAEHFDTLLTHVKNIETTVAKQGGEIHEVKVVLNVMAQATGMEGRINNILRPKPRRSVFPDVGEADTTSRPSVASNETPRNPARN